nr:uncharacterized protein LOC127487530 [Oryctolagus cuniculus]
MRIHRWHLGLSLPLWPWRIGKLFLSPGFCCFPVTPGPGWGLCLLCRFPQSGVSPLQVPQAGVSPLQVPQPGVSPLQVLQAGVSPLQVLQSGVSPLQVPQPGVSPLQVPQPGVSPLQVLQAGVSALQPLATPALPAPLFCAPAPLHILTSMFQMADAAEGTVIFSQTAPLGGPRLSPPVPRACQASCPYAAPRVGSSGFEAAGSGLVSVFQPRTFVQMHRVKGAGTPGPGLTLNLPHEGPCSSGVEWSRMMRCQVSTHPLLTPALETVWLRDPTQEAMEITVRWADCWGGRGRGGASLSLDAFCVSQRSLLFIPFHCLLVWGFTAKGQVAP